MLHDSLELMWRKPHSQRIQSRVNEVSESEDLLDVCYCMTYEVVPKQRKGELRNGFLEGLRAATIR